MKTAIHSLQDWWANAGVDLSYDWEPSALLAEPLAEKTPKSDTKSNFEPSQIPNQAVPETIDLGAPNEDFPTEYEAFQNWLKDPENLLESAWAKKVVYPNGGLEPEVMTVSAMPEAGGIDDEQYYSANETILLKNMLSAIGVEWENSFRTALSFGRTIDGRIADDHIKPMMKRAQHLISLVKPKQIIIFGDTASRAFFDENLLTARKKKQYINHVSSKTEAIITFHPRILLERPELKAEAWKDLQMLTRISTS